ncbi:MAG: ferritin [Deltaproteobacteria bacterium]|nr:ferritin [Deltaproteobacteria bacterium]
MINERIAKLINDQMNFEVESAYLYFAMAADLDCRDLDGFSNWMKIQGQEELQHVTRFYTYLVEREGRPFFTGMPAPQKEWESPLSIFQAALVHERKVTDRINKIITAAHEEGDHATVNYVNWFINEQIEEEANVKTVIAQLKLIQDSGQGMFMLNKELAARQLTVPPAQTQ